MTASIRTRPPSVRRAGGRACPSPIRRAARLGAPRSPRAVARSAQLPADGRGRPSIAAKMSRTNAATASALVVGPAQDLAFDRVAQDAVAALHLDRQVPDLGARPPDELAAGPRSFARDHHPGIRPGRGPRPWPRGSCTARRGRRPRPPSRPGPGSHPSIVNIGSTTARTFGVTASGRGAISTHPLRRIGPPTVAGTGREASTAPSLQGTVATCTSGEAPWVGASS